MSVQIVEGKLRTVLVVGATEADARAFIADENRRRGVPDGLWPTTETLAAEFCAIDAVPSGRGYDLAFVTSGAVSAATGGQVADDAGSRAAAMWVEPPC